MLLEVGQWYRAQLVEEPVGVKPSVIPSDLRGALAVKVSANNLSFSTEGGVYRLLTTNIVFVSEEGRTPLAITTADVQILGRCDAAPNKHELPLSALQAAGVTPPT